LGRDGIVIHLTCLRRSGYAQAGAWPDEVLERGLLRPLGNEREKLGEGRKLIGLTSSTFGDIYFLKNNLPDKA